MRKIIYISDTVNRDDKEMIENTIKMFNLNYYIVFSINDDVDIVIASSTMVLSSIHQISRRYIMISPSCFNEIVAKKVQIEELVLINNAFISLEWFKKKIHIGDISSEDFDHVRKIIRLMGGSITQSLDEAAVEITRFKNNQTTRSHYQQITLRELEKISNNSTSSRTDPILETKNRSSSRTVKQIPIFDENPSKRNKFGDDSGLGAKSQRPVLPVSRLRKKKSNVQSLDNSNNSSLDSYNFLSQKFPPTPDSVINHYGTQKPSERNLKEFLQKEIDQRSINQKRDQKLVIITKETETKAKTKVTPVKIKKTENPNVMAPQRTKAENPIPKIPDVKNQTISIEEMSSFSQKNEDSSQKSYEIEYKFTQASIDISDEDDPILNHLKKPK